MKQLLTGEIELAKGLRSTSGFTTTAAAAAADLVVVVAALLLKYIVATTVCEVVANRNSVVPLWCQPSHN